jgi:DNA invertase Pin-like site-specific DNA recombinase
MIHGYIRVSTEDQAREGRSSLDDQERKIRAIASLIDTPQPSEVTVWADRGISGAIPLSSRPEGFRMLQTLTDGDTLIAAKLDRLFRSAADALTQSNRWRTQNLDLILADMGTEPVTSSATGRIYFGMLSLFAEFERERIAERIKDGKTSKRLRGGFVGGHAPFGLKVEGQGPSAIVLPDQTEATILSYVRNLGDQGYRPTQIARELALAGFLSRANTPITAAQVWRWLRR